MVNTRHSAEDKRETPNELLCLQMRKYGKQNKKGDQDHSDEESEDSVEESRNTRSNRLRAQERARYAEAEDLEVELKPRRRRRTRILIDDSGDDDHEVITRQPRISSSRKPSTRGKFHSDHARNEYRQEYDDDDDDVRVRRSGRQRKLVYGTFDQKVLDRAVYEGGFEVKPCRKRKTMEVDPVDVEECPDMYSRVKRKRKNIKRDMYGIPIPESDQEEEENDDDEEDDDDDNEDDDQDGDEEDDNNENDDNDDGKDDNDEEDEENDPPKRSYYLREHKPRTQLYAIPVETRRSRSQNLFRDTSPVTRRRKAQPIYRSPAHRKKNLRRRTAFNRGESSTSSSSSSSGESSDEERFQRRKAKSMAKSRNRCLPLNFDKDDLSASMVMKDRIKIGSSLADVDPMTFDKSVTFDTVGGLGKHIRALKEMIVFPLMYPEVFEKFKITPPRGCLFYGPPGTGKTLVARALANECSNEERRVAFFMRKGADCLSKWVGESERQLRLLFDQAYQMRPSIIFFDEIDGLAPVRSSRQDQIHSSIVSTLLALMDGLDNRGEIVVIGATNRIDSIDPALRRPGRFDREFLFPLPSEESRRQILHIHTRDWNPKLSDCFVREVASKTVGYCGADLKSLCTESALLALRRRYPQIYTTNVKLQLDVSAINISAKDFFYAMQNIVPASQRCHSAPGHALVMYIQPLMKNTLQNTLTILQGIFPTVLAQLKDLNAPASSSQTKGASNENADWPSDDDENVPNIFEVKGKRKSNAVEDVNSVFLSFSTSYAYKQPSTFRPRLLLCGEPGQGQTVHLAPAVLHHLEQLPVHVLDLPSLYGVSAKTAEEACAQIFREAKVSAPSILYIPHIDQLWNVLGDTLKSTMVTMLQDIFPSSPILVLATCERKYMQLDIELAMLFNENYNEVVTMTNPSTAERQAFFSDLLLVQTTVPPSTKKSAAKRMLEVLPKAPPPEPRKLTEQEQKLLFEKEESVLRELRLFLRDVLNKLGRDRKFAIFAKPVDIEDVPDYYDIITKPMDLSTMMSKIDLHQYQCGKDFMKDIDLICSNCLEYNPATDPTGRAIRHRACALKDTAHAIMKAELDPDFEKQCVDIVSSRKKRGIDPSESAPKYYKTLPVQKKSMNDQQSESAQDQSNLLADDDSTRRSRRLRGRDVEPFTPLEYVEKQWKVQKSKSPTRPKHPIDSEDVTPEKEIEEEPRNNCKNEEQNTPLDEKYIEEKSQEKPMAKKILFAKSASPLKARTKKKEVWSYRKRRGRWKRHSFPLAGHIKRDISRKFRTGDTTEEEDLDLVQHHVQRVTKKVVPDVVTDSQDTCVSSQESQEQTPVAKKSLAEEKLSSVIKHTETCETSVDTPNDTNKLSSSPSQPKDAVTVKNESKESSKESSHCHNPNVIDAHNTRSHRSVKSQESHSYTESDNQTSSQEAEEVKKENSDKAISKPATPLLGGAVISEVDSGVGSCVDSNADSLDSVDQAKKLANLTVTEKCAEEPEAILETVEEPMDTTPPLRLTRSRLQTAEQEKALAILEEPAQPLVVDRERLGLLLDKVVQETQYYHVECLEKLHCMLSQIIYLHRENYDKTKLLKDLEDCVARYTSIVAAQS